MDKNIDQISYQEMGNWLRLLGMKQLITVLESDVNDEKKREAYQQSDGKRSTRNIGKLVHVNKSTINNWWKKWTPLGLGEYTITKGGGHRFKRTFDLESLGLLTIQKSKRKLGKKTLEKDEEKK